jgi:catechol 2,3-dioxygenase-like lactoylglutathione lyase family enzyme
VSVTHVFLGIPVVDRAGAIDWYTRLIGQPPDMLPNEREAAWQLAGAGWLYVLVDPPRAGSSLNTLLVDDLDGFLAGLAERRIDAGPVEAIGEDVRQAIVADPDGNLLKIAQPFS